MSKSASYLILSNNVFRRNIPKSVQAMAVAIARPEAKHGGDRKSNNAALIDKANVRPTSLSQARAIIREFGVDSEQVSFVMAGGSLEEAYERARTHNTSPHPRLESGRMPWPCQVDKHDQS